MFPGCAAHERRLVVVLTDHAWDGTIVAHFTSGTRRSAFANRVGCKVFLAVCAEAIGAVGVASRPVALVRNVYDAVLFVLFLSVSLPEVPAAFGHAIDGAASAVDQHDQR